MTVRGRESSEDAANRRGGGPHVLVIGGGFAGLHVVKALRGARVRITLVDKANHHLFQPLLYQVATAALPATDVAVPIRKIFRKDRNVQVILDEAVHIDPARQRVTLRSGEIAYDFLVLATGSRPSYFGHPEWERFAPGLKTIRDAIEIRRRVLLAFEAAERESDPVSRQRWLRFVIVGGGPTGVELAGAIAEIARETLAKDFRRFSSREAEVILVEAAPDILMSYRSASRAKARKQLNAIGVQVRTNTGVTAIDPDGVQLGGQHLDAKTVLWAAGIEGSELSDTPGLKRSPSGRVAVQADLTVAGHPNFYIAGDLAMHVGTHGVAPAVAPVAIQQGRHVAKNIRRALAGKSQLPFTWKNHGALATIGRKAAVAEMGKLRLSGLVAWLAWLFVHVVYLVGFRSRLSVLFEWAWAYFTKQRGARVVLELAGRLPPAWPLYEDLAASPEDASSPPLREPRSHGPQAARDASGEEGPRTQPTQTG